MSAIESFAADVAHEIKNPLSSLRSAVETGHRIEDPTDRSAADGDHSQRRRTARPPDHRYFRRLRLDAELGRLEWSRSTSPRCWARSSTCTARGDPERQLARLVLAIGKSDRDLIVLGIETRLSQVFRNLIGNAEAGIRSARRLAKSASAARHEGRAVLVTVEDEDRAFRRQVDGFSTASIRSARSVKVRHPFRARALDSRSKSSGAHRG
jgi:two-component system sensor histidine kinase ChvG